MRPPTWNAPSPARLIWFAENIIHTPVPVKIRGIMDSTTFPIFLLLVSGPVRRYLIASTGWSLTMKIIPKEMARAIRTERIVRRTSNLFALLIHDSLQYFIFLNTKHMLAKLIFCYTLHIVKKACKFSFIHNSKTVT